MLETPTFGRFLRENRYLIFEPHRLYLVLVYACIFGGGLCALYGLYESSTWHQMVGLAVGLSGIWANISLVRIRFDLKNRTYRRRQGPGFIPKLWQGSVDDLDAIVVVASASVLAAGALNYHIVLHWKQHRAPLMLLESETRFTMGGPPQMSGQQTVAKAAKFAEALRLPLYDNTHFISSPPVTVW